MIPQRRVVLAAAFLALAAAAAAFSEAVAGAWPWIAALALAVAAADAVAVARVAAPKIERRVARSMSLGTWTSVRLTIRNELDDRPLKIRLVDHFPGAFDVQDIPQSVTVAERHFAEIAYRVCPTRRGLYEFAGVELLIGSPLGLWWRRRFVEQSAEVRVYPNYATISRLLAYEVDSHLNLTGVQLRARRGEGTSFHQLREYREGDSMRSIDWKATARMRRLIAREYQDEQDQQVLFLIDAGRRMRARDSQISHFDHTLNAVLLLSYVALRRGDSVGVMTVGENRAWLPPGKGLDTINGLLNHLYDVQPAAQEIDLIAAATDLAVRQRRRSLVVILTNIRDEDAADVVAATGLLGKRHLVLVASLREAALDDSLHESVRSFDDALRYSGTTQYLEHRRESHNLLRARGVFVDDCRCEDLPMAITNRYLAIKRAGML